MWDSWFKKEQKWRFRNPENSPFYSKLWPKYTMLDDLMLTRATNNHFSTRIWRKNRNIPKNVFWCFSRGTYPLKGALWENNNKQACFLNTESLVLDIACKDLRNELRSKDMKRCRHKSYQTAVFWSENSLLHGRIKAMLSRVLHRRRLVQLLANHKLRSLESWENWHSSASRVFSFCF